jgi:multiple sugar transport system permease protein
MKSKGWREREDNFWGWFFVLIPLLFLAVFFVYPFISSIRLVFSDWNPNTGYSFIGLANLREAFQDQVFLADFGRILLYALYTVPLGLILAIAVAMGLNKVAARGLWRTIYFIPVVCSSVATAMMWRWCYNNEGGLFNNLLRLVGLQGQGWLTDPAWQLVAISVITLWTGTGYWSVIFLAGLNDIPDVYYEAAKIDGASGWSVFRHITLPLLSPSILYYLVMANITVWQFFDLPYLMTPNAISTHMPMISIYQVAFGEFRLGYAAALSWVLALWIFAIMLFNFFIGKRYVNYDR